VIPTWLIVLLTLALLSAPVWMLVGIWIGAWLCHCGHNNKPPVPTLGPGIRGLFTRKESENGEAKDEAFQLPKPRV
jgi:hypothetical protein